MNFEKLKVAIELNKSEKPSLTLAFCMIQSIIQDMEQESGGKDFRLIDIGNADQYRGLLGNQLRLLLRTYQSTSEQLQGSVKKLDEFYQKLTQVEKELEELEEAYKALSDIREKLQTKTKEKENLTKRLNERQQTKEQYETLCAECENLKKQIEEISDFEISEKQNEKSELQGEHAKVTQWKNKVTEYMEDKKKFRKKTTVLQYINDPDFIKKAQLIKERITIATQMKDSLERCSVNIKKELGVQKGPILNELHEDVAADFKMISMYLDRFFETIEKMSNELFADLDEVE